MITQPTGNSNHSYSVEHSMLLKQISKMSDVWYVTIGMANVLFSIPVREKKLIVSIVCNG